MPKKQLFGGIPLVLHRSMLTDLANITWCHYNPHPPCDPEPFVLRTQKPLTSLENSLDSPQG